MEAAYVYRLAGTLGSELQRLSDRFGTASLAGLVPQVVRLLELLETLAVDGTSPGPLPGAPSDEESPGAAAECSRQVRRPARSPGREGSCVSPLLAWARGLPGCVPRARPPPPGATCAEGGRDSGGRARGPLGICASSPAPPVPERLAQVEAGGALLLLLAGGGAAASRSPGAGAAPPEPADPAGSGAAASPEPPGAGPSPGSRAMAKPKGRHEAALCPASEGPGRRERELMLQLKEVVDHQRDKIRAQDHEIQRKARDTEAEQLNRFMTVNENLRQKVAVVQAQLRSALERKAEAEALWEAERRGRAAGPARTSTPTEQEEGGVGEAAAPPEHPPDQCTFSKEELQQILQERNELKTSLFLVEEELAYYQRELLNGERVPALHAVKSAIKKQRKKIWAKMLGTEEEPAGREEDEEEEEGEGWPIGSPGADHTDGHLPGSRIKSFFSQWYRRSSQPSPTESRPGTWEIISAEDVGPGEEEREEAPPRGSSSPPPTSPLP
ncbi:rab-interacting lysosomal protein isoform 3-T3 [Vipera latastei]